MNNMNCLLAFFVVLLVTACADRQIVDFDSAVVQTNNLNDFDFDGVIDERENCNNTVLGALIDNNGCQSYQKFTEPYSLVLHFEHDSYIVPAQDYVSIQKLADILKQQSDVKILIEGHSSQVGTQAYNQKLSLNRANEVADILIERFNIAEQRISTIGYGSQSIINLGDNDEAHQSNRRTSIAFTYAKKIEEMKWTIYSVNELK